ncbi:hypothetical protein [Aquipseudomonas ullengensis]|uniref:Uncharacterized protein n=1 Tax=Aquipseudomonas ullengensis TaxID=2759166 RepID=A0A7W4LMC7_9GAMM|nr:hypothetical protein [Pseudomonas ullengensis]MBB2495816.1 hypothetical protein [Pseudomonas ullengensis]
MSNGVAKNNHREILLVISLLIIAIAIRLISISHNLSLDWNDHARVLSAFFRTQSRFQILLVQFSGIILLFALLPYFAKKEISALRLTAILLIAVSVARYFFPTFLTSIVGDLVALSIIALAANEFRAPKIALGLFVLIVIVLVPPGLWVMAFAMIAS